METRRESQKQKAARRRKMIQRRRLIVAALSALLLIVAIAVLLACTSTSVNGGGDAGDGTDPSEGVGAVVHKPETSEQTEMPVGSQAVDQTDAPTEEPTEPPVFFKLTDEERTLIEQVVSAESRGEPYDGQVAVAQCILNACLKHDIRPEAALKKYHYTGARAEPTDSVREAVAAVFDRGEGVTEEPILYFYNPHLCTSTFHESQIFVIEIANHRFFKEAA